MTVDSKAKYMAKILRMVHEQWLFGMTCAHDAESTAGLAPHSGSVAGEETEQVSPFQALAEQIAGPWAISRPRCWVWF